VLCAFIGYWAGDTSSLSSHPAGWRTPPETKLFPQCFQSKWWKTGETSISCQNATDCVSNFQNIPGMMPLTPITGEGDTPPQTPPPFGASCLDFGHMMVPWQFHTPPETNGWIKPMGDTKRAATIRHVTSVHDVKQYFTCTHTESDTNIKTIYMAYSYTYRPDVFCDWRTRRVVTATTCRKGTCHHGSQLDVVRRPPDTTEGWTPGVDSSIDWSDDVAQLRCLELDVELSRDEVDLQLSSVVEGERTRWRDEWTSVSIDEDDVGNDTPAAAAAAAVHPVYVVLLVKIYSCRSLQCHYHHYHDAASSHCVSDVFGSVCHPRVRRSQSAAVQSVLRRRSSAHLLWAPRCWRSYSRALCARPDVAKTFS